VIQEIHALRGTVLRRGKEDKDFRTKINDLDFKNQPNLAIINGGK